MDFLCILQVSRLHNYFTVFNLLWTRPQFLESAGVSRVKILRHRATQVRTAGLILKTRGALLKDALAEGVWVLSGRPI
jgi:hypothetical protein